MPAQGRLLVAVVDDEEAVRRALSRFFRAAGHDVETFVSGTEFLAYASVARPDCAVVDLHLPGLTALEVLARLAADGIDLPTVVVSGHQQSGAGEKALAAGASAFVAKPLDAEKLLDVVHSAVRGSERSR